MKNPLILSFPISLLFLAAPVIGQDTPLELRVAAKKGGQVWLTQENKQEQVMDIGGQEMEVAHTTVHTLQVTVKEVDDKNGLVVETKIVRIHGSISSPMGGDMEFDSAAPPSNDDEGGGMGMPSPAMLTKAMTALAGQTFTAKVDGTGKVQSLEGATEILAAAKKASRGMGGTASESTLRNFVEGAFGSLPDKPVAVGASWNRDVQGSSDGPGTKLQLTLAKADADAIEITATGTVENPAEAKPSEGETTEVKNMRESMKVKNSKVTGSQRVSRQDGFVLESRSETTLDADMQTPMGDVSATIKSIRTTKRTTEEAAMPKKPDAATTPTTGAPKEGPKEGPK